MKTSTTVKRRSGGRPRISPEETMSASFWLQASEVKLVSDLAPHYGSRSAVVRQALKLLAQIQAQTETPVG